MYTDTMPDDVSAKTLAWSEWLGEPLQGTFEQGVGTSTGQLQNPNVSMPGETGTTGAVGDPPLLQSPGVWFVLVGILVVIKMTSERAGKASEFATVRIGLENWFLVGTLASLWFFVMKTAVKTPIGDRYIPPAVKQFFGAI